MMTEEEHKVYVEEVRARRAIIKRVVHPMFIRKPSNDVFMKTDKHFIDACNNSNTTITVRQASKFRNKKGAAYASIKRG